MNPSSHAILLALALSSSAFADTPAVEVSNVRRVFDHGAHNAFTDLVVFRSSFFLAFRTCPDGHGVSPDASIVILSSRDAISWTEVHRFSVPGRDTRDPHFLVFGDKLFVYTGTWFSGDEPRASKDLDLNQHLGYTAVSKDGKNWSEPQMLEGTFGHYIWRAAQHGGKAYLCGRRKFDFEIGPRGEPDRVQSLMLESDDGLIWRKRASFQEIDGDETAFLFERDGSVLAIARRGGNQHAQRLRSAPPYEHWQREDLDRSIGGPLLARWGGRTVAGGRHTTTDDGPKTSLCWLEGDKLSEFAHLPSGGDNSYPGFIAITATKALVSWYSSHEGGTASIYLAELNIVQDSKDFSDRDLLLITEADNILNRQRNNGGWPKGHLDDGEMKLLFERDANDTTLDNGATHREIRFLAEAFTETGLPRFRHGCSSGVEFLLDAQYANGGWPQRFPRPRGYAQHITFNDGSMIGALGILRSIARGEEPFKWCDDPLRERAGEALIRGIDCILKCQIEVDGKLTAWGQQHDETDFRPAPARSFEPASLCSSESVGIVRFLMEVENPSSEVIASVEAAVAWLDGPAKLEGIRQARDGAKGKIIVNEPDAAPLWARLYEIGSNRPIFGDRDEKIYYSLAEISDERRNGYSWYGDSPAKLLRDYYPKWKSQH